MAQSNVVNFKKKTKKKPLCCVLLNKCLFSYQKYLLMQYVPEEVLLKGQGDVDNCLSFSMGKWDGTEFPEQFHN